MCKCTPEIRTPWCGKPGCEMPEQVVTERDLLRWAEEALRDIRERVEHAGTTERMMAEINAIVANYWLCKSRTKLRTMHVQVQGD